MAGPKYRDSNAAHMPRKAAARVHFALAAIAASGWGGPV